MGLAAFNRMRRERAEREALAAKEEEEKQKPKDEKSAPRDGRKKK